MKSRILLSGIVALLVFACGEEAPPPEPVVRPIKVLELSGSGERSALEFPGRVKAGETANLAFEVPGKLIERPIAEGQVVEAGTLLARLDPRDFEMELSAQDARRVQAEAELSRSRKLFQADVISQQELEVKIRNLQVTEARVEQASKALDDTRLLAPFAGTVALIHVENFENVKAKQQVLVFENDASFDVVVAIPEQDAGRLTPGVSLEERTRLAQPVIELSAIPGRSFAAKLTELATAADPATRTFSATFRFENPGDVTINSGMTAKVIVQVPEGFDSWAGLRIPSLAAAADETGKAYVWVVDPTSLAVARRSVELGEFSGDSVAISSGLDGNEWIAVSGVQHLREGMVVRRLGE